MVLLVWLDGPPTAIPTTVSVSLLDAIYYATVTTHRQRATATSPPLRRMPELLNAIVVTPLRIAFLVLLVGTTLEVLAHHGRRMFKDARWRKRMRNHIVVVGFGTKGRSAVETLKNNGTNPNQVVIIDSRPSAITDANLRGTPRSKVTQLGVKFLRRAESHEGA